MQVDDAVEECIDEFACPQCGAVLRAQMSDRGILNLPDDERLIDQLADWLRTHADHLDTAQAAASFVDYLRSMDTRRLRSRPVQRIDVSRTGYL